MSEPNDSPFGQVADKARLLQDIVDLLHGEVLGRILSRRAMCSINSRSSGVKADRGVDWGRRRGSRCFKYVLALAQNNAVPLRPIAEAVEHIHTPALGHQRTKRRDDRIALLQPVTNELHC
jgi:hypothetical protein